MVSTNLSPSKDVWRLKEIHFPPGSGNRYKIVMQNSNGPCGFICICNILILREAIRIEPANRKTASYEYLSSLIGEHLLDTGSEDLGAALGVLPSTQQGMDLNPQFTGLSSFRPEGDGGVLKLFHLCGITLVHGWLADPSSEDFEVIARAQDYDTALNMIVAGEEATAGGSNASPSVIPLQSATTIVEKGSSDADQVVLESMKIVKDNNSASPAALGQMYFSPTAASSNPVSGPLRTVSRPEITTEQPQIMPSPEVPIEHSNQSNDTQFRDALVLREFIENHGTQLTYHGLFSLINLEQGLYAFIRNSHLSVLYKSETDRRSGEESDSPTSLWMLVTDSNLATEPSVVWESLEDVEGAASRFVDSELRSSSTAGGDFAGRSAEEALREAEAIAQASSPEYRADLALARRLQQEEDTLVRNMERSRLADEDSRPILRANAPTQPRNGSLAHEVPPQHPQRAADPEARLDAIRAMDATRKKKECVVMKG